MKYSAGAYHRRRTGRLWWCRPLARESRSTSPFATSPRFCSYCSSGAAPRPRRFPSGRGALSERGKEWWGGGGGVCNLHPCNHVMVISPPIHRATLAHTAGLGLNPLRISLSSLGCPLCIPVICLNNGQNDYGKQTTNSLKGALLLYKVESSSLLIHHFKVRLFIEWPKVRKVEGLIWPFQPLELVISP